jgi:hypothetical protein
MAILVLPDHFPILNAFSQGGYFLGSGPTKFMREAMEAPFRGARKLRDRSIRRPSRRSVLKSLFLAKFSALNLQLCTKIE